MKIEVLLEVKNQQGPVGRTCRKDVDSRLFYESPSFLCVVPGQHDKMRISDLSSLRIGEVPVPATDYVAILLSIFKVTSFKRVYLTFQISKSFLQ